MIEVMNTKNLMGVTIKGDYNDLNALYDALSRVNDMYLTIQRENIEREKCSGQLGEYQERAGYHFYQEFEDCMLGLNYDIRHAYQGDRGICYEENGADHVGWMAECLFEVDKEAFEEVRTKGSNGNLYYTVDILYPWALYYMINITPLLECYGEGYFQKMIFPYDEIQFRMDQSILEHFKMQLWKCFKSAVGKKKGLNAFQMHEYRATEANCTSLYGTVLCHYYCDKKKTGKRLKKAMLLAMFYEMLDYEPVMGDGYVEHISKSLLNNCDKDYDNALDRIVEETGSNFLKQTDFYVELEEAAELEEDILSYEKREAFFARFGEVDWDGMKW